MTSPAPHKFLQTSRYLVQLAKCFQHYILFYILNTLSNYEILFVNSLTNHKQHIAVLFHISQ